MDRPKARNFQEIGVGNVAYQSSKERFGEYIPPDHAEWRMNLTALSQRYNLYFAAYEGMIHVSIPQGLKQTLPRTPEIKLALPRGPDGIMAGGYIDSSNPHSVNHMIIGNLGIHEVLLMACDDGDIIAYYTHQLNAEISRSLTVQRGSISETVPMFHENVGRSAWGLAVHQNSRLIAVSSNKHQITVFAFAIEGNTLQSKLSNHGSSNPNEAFPLRSSHPISAHEGRHRGYKLLFGRMGHNIPSLDFSSDQDFDADSIFATDVCGNLWSLDLWVPNRGFGSLGPSSLHLRYSSDHHPTVEIDKMGWGILVIPLRDFKIESTPQMALGCDQPAIVQHARGFFDINYTKGDVRNTADTLSPTFESAEADTTTIQDTERVSEKVSNQNLTTEVLRRSLNPPRPFIADKTCWQDYLRKLKSLKPMKLPGIRNFFPDLDKVSSPEGVAIFQALRTSVQLLPMGTLGLPSTICHDVLSSVTTINEIWNTPNADGPTLIHYHRLNMIAKVPELSLLIVASQIGAVALFTLTRLENGFSQHGPVVMLRLDLVLPFSQHAGFLKNKNPVPLLGIAVSPQPSSEPWDARKSTRPRRWRLMLTYFTGAVLSYELSRGENDDLWII